MNPIPPDHRQALPHSDASSSTISRRGLLVTSLALGFAQATTPVMAQTITTGTDGLVAGEVSVPVDGGMMPAYRAMPAEGGPFPTIIVIQEIFGVHEHIRDLCRRLAKLGYYAISGELYARQGDVSKIADISEIIAKIVSKVPDDQVDADLDRLVSFADASGMADTARLGVTGFCWGGRATWRYAAHNPSVKAAVAWYGMVDPPAWNPEAESVFQLLPRLEVPVLGLYGEKDTSMPVEHVEKLRQELAGTASKIVIYPGVQHGFNADYRPSYDLQAATDGWRRLQDWFTAHGVI